MALSGRLIGPLVTVVYSPRIDDRDQVVDRCCERLAIFQELRPFVRFCVNLTWYTVPQNPVFFFK